MPLVSVIIPVYKSAAVIDRCLGSVLNSTYTKLEVICVNDGSPDDCGERLKAWQEKDARIKYIEKENGGVSSARNIALQHINGEYVTFVDADDTIDADYIQLMLEAAQQYNADCVCTGCTLHDLKQKAKPVPVPLKIMSPPLPSDLRYMQQAVWAHLYKTETLKKSGATFPLNIRYGEDTAFHYAIFPYCRTYIQIPTPGYHYWEMENSASSKKEDTVTDMLKATEWLGQQYQKRGMTPDRIDLLVGFAGHSMQHIRKSAKHSIQKEAAEMMRKLLIHQNVKKENLNRLKKRVRKMMAKILDGDMSLGFSYYRRRILRKLHLSKR
jgi:glycosyltransferase involved in cell wall biosynthesis